MADPDATGRAPALSPDPAGAEPTTAVTIPDMLGTLVPGAAGTRADLTIRPTPASLEEGEDAALAGLAQVAAPLSREVELLSTLGEGGMGVVRLGKQRSLDRLVAVKSVNPATRQGSARRALMLEAWAASTLEHPNVVPVHTLAVDEQGDPHLVMRRIQGRTWREYLDDPDAVQRTFGVRDPTGWHLGVLLSICNAMEYAHSRGILHRDLKPDNVMIGRFGEVWVLDWGLAVRLREDGPVRLPLAHNERRLVGTPRYMAPEMAAADGARLSERTDVYLLGGLLYTVLTGRGPHLGDDAAETLRVVPEFRAHLPPGTPHALATIVRRAMALQPADRFPSVQALRLALQAFLEERTADNLARQAGQQLVALEHDLEAEVPDRQQVYRHFGACRFGFQQALLAWPDHGEATACLRRALIRMARYELDQGDLRAASVHLAEVEEPPAELVARRDALQAAQTRAEDEVRRLRADLDPALGQRTRVFVFGLVTVGWTLIPLVAWALELPLTHRRLLLTHGIMLVVVVGLVVWARDSLGRTALNRTVAHMLVVVQLFILVSLLVGRGLGLSPEQVTITHDLLFGAVAALLIERVGRIAALPAVAYTLAAVVAVGRPDWIAPLNAVCNGVVAALIYRAWGRQVVDRMGSTRAALFSPASPPPGRAPPGDPPAGPGPR